MCQKYIDVRLASPNAGLCEPLHCQRCGVWMKTCELNRATGTSQVRGTIDGREMAKKKAKSRLAPEDCDCGIAIINRVAGACQ